MTGIAVTPSFMKAQMLRLYDDANTKDHSMFPDLFSREFIGYGGAAGILHGPDEFEALYNTFQEAIPDLHFDATFMVSENDLTFIRGTLQGTNAGNFMGAPPTGKHMIWTGTELFRFDSAGRIDRRWQEWDGLGVMQQLGIVPTPPGQAVNLPTTAHEPNPTATDTNPERIAANRRLMERFVDEVWNKGNLDVADELFTADHTSPDAPGLPAGPEGVKVIATMFRDAFPDFHMDIHLMAAEGDRVAAHFIETGTHQGAIFGIEPTGKQVSFGEMGFLHIRDGKVFESFYNTDMLGLMQQLGVGGDAGSEG